MLRTFILISLSAIFLASSCVKKIGFGVCDTGPVFLYKLKDTSYNNLLTGLYDSTSGNFDPIPFEGVEKLEDGYRIGFPNYPNAVTSVSISSFLLRMKDTVTLDRKQYLDSLKLKIIDRHPLSELYSVCLCSHGGDTATINNFIRIHVANPDANICDPVRLP